MCSCAAAAAPIPGFAPSTVKNPVLCGLPRKFQLLLFGCGVGGDAITFVRKINNLDYIEAVLLASRVGMPLPDERDDAGRLKRRILE